MRHYSDELDFISVIIPAYQRFHYLEELIESIHDNADYPFEIVIHDDNSNDGTREKILSELKDKVSSVILNNGLQLGLASSINRCVDIAGSNYIVMLNADCRIEAPIFKDIVNILDCPFVGTISLMTAYKGQILKNNNTEFQLLRGIGAGCAQAFSKDIFEKVGGWYSHNVSSGNADVSFIIRLIKNGYFITALAQDISSIKNLSMEIAKGLDSTIARGLYDCSFPKIFNLHKSKYPIFDFQDSKTIYEYFSRKRYDDASHFMQITYRTEEGDTNLDYWHKFMEKLIDENYNINPELAKKWGHDKWIDTINALKI